MDISRLLLIICLTVLIGVGLPAVVYYWARRENITAMMNTLNRAAQATRNPWQKEAQDLDELSRRVAALKEKRDQEEERHEDQPTKEDG
jgi:hypothetical protein